MFENRALAWARGFGILLGGLLVERGRRGLMRLLLADEEERQKAHDRLAELKLSVAGLKGGSAASAPEISPAPRPRGRPRGSTRPRPVQSAAPEPDGAKRAAQLAALAKGRETRKRNAEEKRRRAEN